MKRIVVGTWLAIILLLSQESYAQEKDYTLKVVDSESNQSVEGVSVSRLTGKAAGLTNADGIYVLTVSSPPRIRLSHVRYQDTVLLLEQAYQNIYLRPKVQAIEEVIVQQKNINDVDIRNLVGSVVTVDIARLAERSEMDMARLLEGQVPGLAVTYSGELGTKPEIRIRGNSSFSYQGKANEPLFVMDGVIISTETFLTLNPSDFEKIKVLKDAPATALYGIKAANGVIELTSKKGFVGKPSVSVYMKQGLTMRGERQVDMMRSEEKLLLEERMERTNLPGYIYSERYIRHTYANAPDLETRLSQGKHTLDSLRQYDTDWFREMIRLNHFQSYNMHIRGGSDRQTYFYAVNYGKQGGRVPGNDLNQITARVNYDYRLSDRLSLSLNNNVGISNTNTQNGMDNDPTELAYSLNPYETKETTLLTSYPGRSYADLVNQYTRKTVSKRLSSTAIAHWDVLKGLDLSGVVGIDYGLEESKQRIYSWAYSQQKNPEKTRGYISEGDTKTFGFSSNVRANYQRQFGLHDIYAGINMDYYQSSNKLLSASGNGISDDLESLSGINQRLEKGYAPKISGFKREDKQLGFGAALGYTFSNTYDFYASMKRDGSSVLPSNKRWNDAWSAGVGWSPSNYALFQRQDVISSLKFKASFGYTASLTGLQMRDVTTTFGSGSSYYGTDRLLEFLALPNKNLRPQQTYSTNLAADIGLFRRLNLLVNVYQNLTKQAILMVPIAASNGFSSYAQNIGELQNKGIEFALSGDIIRQKEFRWNSSLSLSYNENLVKKLYGTDRIYLTDQSPIPEYEVGKPLGLLYGTRSNGIHPLSGLPEYLDMNGQVINLSNELQASYFQNLGHSIAPYMGYFNNYFSYKNWSFTMNINYGAGGVAQQRNSFVRDASSAGLNAIAGQLQDMWFEPGDENKIYPAKELPSIIHNIQQYPTNRGIYKTDFIKINYVQLAYNWLPTAQVRKYLKSVRWILQADNIYTYRLEKDRGNLNNITQPILTFSLHATL